MSERFEPLDEHEILSFDSGKLGNQLQMQANDFIQVNLRSHELISRIIKRINVAGATKEQLFGEGIEGEALRFDAKGWQKGKFRITMTVEFSPDEPEVPETPTTNQPEISSPSSPLDDIRRMIKQDTQLELTQTNPVSTKYHRRRLPR